MKISFANAPLPTHGTLVVGILAGKEMTPSAKILDERSGGALTRALAAAKFDGKKDQTLTLLSLSGLFLDRLILVGLGKGQEITDSALQSAGGVAQAALAASGAEDGVIAIDLDPANAGNGAAQLALGARLRSYRFDKYRTKEKAGDKPALKKITILSADASGAKKRFSPLDKVADGVFLARDLVSEPPNVIHPESYAKQCRKLEDLGLAVEILGESQMKKLGMGALLGVGQGSERESQLVVMRWQGSANKDAAPVALVGKGVCFDSGGISLKPGAGMEEMKWDMAGSAAVVGAMAALAGRKAPVNVVGVIGLVENMPSGTAQRPSDVVTSMSGQTIEIINTDAEGRLVLADALWYTKEKFKPKAIIDLATLTGAIVISLGHEYAGLFSNDDQLAQDITAAGQATLEKVWRMPMGEAYDSHLKSDIADMKNTGMREGGSISAAHFLKRFVGDTPWAHLDIAGTAWTKKDAPTCPKGASAFGVRLLDHLIAQNWQD